MKRTHVAIAIGLALLAAAAYSQVTSAAWIWSNKLHARVSQQGALLGYSSSISGNTVVIGAMGEGAAYVFDLVDGTWRQHGRLEALDGNPGEEFGKALSLDGNTVVIGRPADDIMSWNSGSAYVFERGIDGWYEAQKLIPLDPFQLDNFGTSVSLDGHRVLIGAKYDDDRGHSSGSAYVFGRHDGIWEQTAKLVAHDGVLGDMAGWSVALQGNIALLGAWGNSRDALFGGVVYVFELHNNSWIQTASIRPSDPQDNGSFGVSVATDGTRIAVGATGPTHDPGAVYLFERGIGGWGQTQKIVAESLTNAAQFGNALSLQGRKLLIGAHRLNGQRGSAYLYMLEDGIWVESAVFRPSDVQQGYQFGWSLDLDGRQAVFGSVFDSSLAQSSGAGYASDARLIPAAVFQDHR